MALERLLNTPLPGWYDVIEVDWKRMADKTIRNKMESFFESIGYSWDGIVNGQTCINAWL